MISFHVIVYVDDRPKLAAVGSCLANARMNASISGPDLLPFVFFTMS